MLEFLKNPIVIAAIGAIIVALVPWSKVGGLLSSVTRKSPAVPEDIDVADMLAAKRLAARFERLNCPEGKAAVQTMLTHFFHQ